MNKLMIIEWSNHYLRHPTLLTFNIARIRKALQICEINYGENHRNSVLVYCSMGMCLNSQRNYKQALSYYERSLQICLKKYGQHHLNSAEIYHWIGWTIYSGNFGKRRRPLGILRKIFADLFKDLRRTSSFSL
jgi:tetratricopeptide (TPR) repeat protein